LTSGEARDSTAAAGASHQVRTGPSQVRPPGQGKSIAALSLTGTLGVLAPVVIALLISVFFVTLFLLAFRSPTPHDLRVGVTGRASPGGPLRQAVAARAPGALDLRDYPDPASWRGAFELWRARLTSAAAESRRDWPSWWPGSLSAR